MERKLVFGMACLLLALSSTAGAAVNFNSGGSQYVSVPSPSADIPVNSSPYTIEAWIKPTAHSRQGIVGWGNYGTGNQVNAFRITDINEAGVTGLVNYWWGPDLFGSTGDLSTGGVWHHVAATWDGATHKMFLDGTQISSQAAARSQSFSATNFRIGSTNNGEYFNGSIDEVRIWNVARTGVEIQNNKNLCLSGGEAGLKALYHLDEGSGTTAADSAGTADNGTLINGATWVAGVTCTSTPGTVLLSENFTSYTPGTFDGGQYQTGLSIYHGGTVPTWTGGGVNHSHAVDRDIAADVGPDVGRNIALQFYDGGGSGENTLTLNTGLAANSSGVSYQIFFDAAPSVSGGASQTTGATNGVQVEVLRGDNSILHTFSFLPGAWPGGANSQNSFVAASTTYVGDGSGNVRVRLSTDPAETNHFGGAIDDLIWVQLAPVTPTATPTNTPTNTPTDTPTATPTDTPTNTPTDTPTATPTNTPTNTPTDTPTATPTDTPTNTPTATPTDTPTNTPTATPTDTPTNTPTNTPTATPTDTPTNTPTNTPTDTPTATPTNTPTNTPTATPTDTPTNTPTATPTDTPTNTPTSTPTDTPTSTPTNTPTVGPGLVVISQVYGGGGAPGAPWKHDFIELFNRGSTPANLAGWSIQYANSASSTWQMLALSGILQPGQYSLIKQGGSLGNGANLPSPDAASTFLMDAVQGKVALVPNTTRLTGLCPAPAAYFDFVAYGAAVNCYEVSRTTDASAANSIQRLGNGCQDTNDNGADFFAQTAVSPGPRNSAYPASPCVFLTPTNTPIPTNTSTPTRTFTPTNTPTPTNTSPPTNTPLSTLTPTVTFTPTVTPIPVGGQMVISQVYSGGGNGGSPWKNDYIELFNRGTGSVDLTGWSVQYANTASVTWQVTALSGTLNPGQYYLVKEGGGAGVGAALPLADAGNTSLMHNTLGKVALVNGTTSLAGLCPAPGTYEDFVGYGAAVTCAEGSSPTADLSNATAAVRSGGGCTDTNNNAADFSVTGAGSPGPRNGAFLPLNPCGSLSSGGHASGARAASSGALQAVELSGTVDSTPAGWSLWAMGAALGALALLRGRGSRAAR